MEISRLFLKTNVKWMFIVLIILAALALFLNKKFNNLLSSLESRIEQKIFYSPSQKRKITLLVYNTSGFNYYTNIYILEGEYRGKKIPIDKEYIKFPDATDVMVRWDIEDICFIYADKYPEYNNLTTSQFEVKIIVDKEKIESFIRDGYDVIRYSIK